MQDKLLVNPRKMMLNAFERIGALLALCGARYVEKTWLRFKPVGFNVKGIVYCLIGLIIFFLISYITRKPLISFFGKSWGRFMWAGLLVFYIIYFYPLILKYFCTPKLKVK